MERTEEDKLSQAGIKVILGGKEYGIAPLVIRDSRIWRKKFIDLIVPLPNLVNTIFDSENPQSFTDALITMLVTNADAVLDLFFDYAQDLNREEIEGTATDSELAKAFEEVMKIAFPLAENLPKALKHIYQ